MTILKKRRSHSRSFKFWQGLFLLVILFLFVAVIPVTQSQSASEFHAQVWSKTGAQAQSKAQLQSRDQAQPLKRYEFSDQYMGTTFKITFYAPGDSIAKAASERAFQHTDELNSILSDYEPASNLNRLSEQSGSPEFFQVDSTLFRVISKAQAVAGETGGAFDITVGPFVKLWRNIRRAETPELPSDRQLRRIRKRVGFWHLKIDSSSTAIALTRPRMQLDLGGIAKGYTADQILQVLQNFGIRSALIDAGGDIRLGDPPPGKESWKIRIPGHAEKGQRRWITLGLANCAIATSGDLFQYVRIDGERYSHIINPRTGLGLTDQLMVTIVAPNGITADSYASAASVMGTADAVSFIESKPDFALRIEYKKSNGDDIGVKKTGTFDQFTID